MQMVKITHISFIAHFDRQLGNQRKFHFNCSYEFWIDLRLCFRDSIFGGLVIRSRNTAIRLVKMQSSNIKNKIGTHLIVMFGF